MSGTAGKPGPPRRGRRPLDLHLGHRAAEHPDRPAVIMAGCGEVTTYRQLDERSNRLAHVLRRPGCAPATTSPS